MSKGNRMVYFIPVQDYVPDHGYRVAIVKEGEGGYYPTGNWPYTAGPGQQMPYFWGHDLEKAQKLCEETNLKMGISPREAAEIIAQSMGLGDATPKAKDGAHRTR